MANKVKWSPRAVYDFEEICEYVSKNEDHGRSSASSTHIYYLIMKTI